MKRWVLIVAVSTMLAVVCAVQFFPAQQSGGGKGRHLSTSLPGQIAGWIARDLELGPTEATNRAVASTLRFDDVYYKEFRSPRAIVSLYVAYWGPSKMPVQLVASHTPDRCWVENGWVCERRVHGETLGVNGVAVLPGEWRLFRAPSKLSLNVIFWHLKGGELYDYGDRMNTVPFIWRWWRDVYRTIATAPAEQYFVRLTSNRPFRELAQDSGWQELTASLADLGLRAGK